MTQTLKKFLIGAKNKEYATKTGTQIHAQLQSVIVDDVNNCGTPELIEKIQNRPDLKRFFCGCGQNRSSNSWLSKRSLCKPQNR